MPYIDQKKKYQDPEEQQRIGSSAPGGGAASAPVAPVGPTAPGAGERPGQFVNLQRYMDANGGQAKTMADKLAQNVTTAARGAQGNLLQRSNGTSPTGNKALMQAEPARAGTPGMAAPAWQPPGPGSAAPAWQQPQQQMQAPGSPEQLAAKYDKTDAAQDQARMLGSAGGRQELLTNAYGQASQGEHDLDNFLVGGASGGRFQDLSRRYGNLTNEMMGRDADYAKSYAADQKRRADESAALTGAGDQRWASIAEANAGREQQAKTQADQLAMAKKAGYHGEDYAGAQAWYYTKFGPDAYAEAFPGAAIPGGLS